MTDPLGNPVWMALSSLQADLGYGGAEAKRYRPDVSPFAALVDASEFRALQDIVTAGELIALLSPIADRIAPQSGWLIQGEVEIYQMICEQPTIDHLPRPGELLTESDALDMYQLAKETDPGPFEHDTQKMGNYFGVRDESNDLIAMAGERMRLPDWVEVSGVCTSEKARGKGYASALVAQVMDPIYAGGSLAFLHVRKGSPSELSAIHVYEKLGYVHHQEVVVQLFQRE